MNKYRISKYNPHFRDKNGIFSKEDWTSYCDIGKVFNGRLFKKEDYLKVENGYCNTIQSILKANGIREVILEDLELNYSIDEMKQMLKLKGLDISSKEQDAIKLLKNDEAINIDNLHLYIRLILRECFWCRLLDRKHSNWIEFGYDYYMYLYSGNILAEEVIEQGRKNGIFVERMAD